MFRQLLNCLGDRFGRRGESAPAAAVVKAARPRAQSTAAPNSGGIGARRPLLSSRGEVAGFEFRIAEPLMRRADSPAQTAHTLALLTAMRVTAQGGRVSLAELPPAWLMKPQVEPLLAPSMLIGLFEDPARPDPALRAQAAQRLRSAGVRVGWVNGDSQAQSGNDLLPDFVLVRPRVPTPVADLLRISHASGSTQPGVGIVMTDLPSLEDLELALRLGAQYACGSVSTSTQPAGSTPIAPAVARVCQLLNRLVRDEEVEALATEIKRDASLSVQLLRYASSVRYSRGSQIDSVEAAVLRVGRNELYKWLSLVLVRSAGGRPTSRALQDVAIARARLFELLAQQRGEQHPSGLFTIGLASMLPVLLNTSAAASLSRLDLGDDARAALLEGTGPWCDYLLIAQALERHDLQAVTRLAGDYGGVEAVLSSAEQAWAWVAEQDAG
jgi:c-di-GMP-related signal transduction protein